MFHSLEDFLKRKTAKEHGESQSKRHRTIKANNEIPVDGMLLMKNMDLKIIAKDQATQELGIHIGSLNGVYRQPARLSMG